MECVYALLRPGDDSSRDTQTGERIRRAAGGGGIRLVIDELGADATRAPQGMAPRGRLRCDDGEHRDRQAAIAWLWRFLDGVRSAGER